MPFPERFYWLVSEDLGQAALSPSDSLLPADRENANVFSTGPTLYLPLSARNRLSIAGLYSDVYYEESDVDNQRLRAAAALERDLGGNKQLTLGYSKQRTDYDALQIEVWTDGSLRPEDALGIAAKILQTQFAVFINFDADGKPKRTTAGELADVRWKRLPRPSSDFNNIFAGDLELKAMALEGWWL